MNHVKSSLISHMWNWMREKKDVFNLVNLDIYTSKQLVIYFIEQQEISQWISYNITLQNNTQIN